MSNNILEMKNITKEFNGIKALDSVNFSVQEGTIHSLCGENGAGKSTLMKVLSGVYSTGEYEGEILFKDNKCKFNNIKDSEELGVVIIHQELALVPQMSVMDNIFLGNEIGSHQKLDRLETVRRSNELLKMVGLDVNPEELVSTLSVGQQQLVEIAKAFSKDVKLLILDEPTAALNEAESKNLLDLLKKFKATGITSILISHKLNEVIEISDRITVIRDGKVVKNIQSIDESTENEIVRNMVGRQLDDRYPDKTAKVGAKIFEVKNWNVVDMQDSNKKIIKNASIYARSGEVVGIAGLMGAGRTEFALSLFGNLFGKKESGEVYLHGKKIDTSTVKKSIKNGLAYVTEDRKGQGLILIEDINKNITLSSVEQFSKRGVIDTHKEIKQSTGYMDKLNIKARDIYQKVEDLSGGNQQKVVLSKWLLTDPEVLILDEPTRGIDVGAKYEIYKIIDEIAATGKSIILISSDLPELLGISDRIYAINDGEITGVVNRHDASEEVIMKYMLGMV